MPKVSCSPPIRLPPVNDDDNIDGQYDNDDGDNEDDDDNHAVKAHITHLRAEK